MKYMKFVYSNIYLQYITFMKKKLNGGMPAVIKIKAHTKYNIYFE